MTDDEFDKWAVRLWRNKGPRCIEVRDALKKAYKLGIKAASVKCNHSYMIAPFRDRICIVCGEGV